MVGCAAQRRGAKSPPPLWRLIHANVEPRTEGSRRIAGNPGAIMLCDTPDLVKPVAKRENTAASAAKPCAMRVLAHSARRRFATPEKSIT